jgi:hypothetical protein
MSTWMHNFEMLIMGDSHRKSDDVNIQSRFTISQIKASSGLLGENHLRLQTRMFGP